MKAITYFDEPPYNFLSNFYVGSPLRVFDQWWKTGEHAFQGMKTTNLLIRDEIAAARTPGDAKRMGRKIRLRDDWEEIKYDVMAAVIRAKFTRDRAEGAMLLDTGDTLLVEGTHWKDMVWGVDLDASTATPPGRNWLGTLLMARRTELRTGLTNYPTSIYRSNEWFVMEREE